MSVSTVTSDTKIEAMSPSRLSILHVYDDTTKCFTRTVTYLNHVYITKMQSDATNPYIQHSVSPSFSEQVAKDFPDVPLEEWDELDELLDEAHDYSSLQEAMNAFFDILILYDYIFV
ncbi:hypothetical protein [Mitsuokella multacida]|uniref:hypothetical protein n=1 Tax=Mitsuokella multacida TaxID=52226 RepID=UPI0026DCC9E9|nr:hypothetical protein [Mitsuokella multacida]